MIPQTKVRPVELSLNSFDKKHASSFSNFLHITHKGQGSPNLDVGDFPGMENNLDKLSRENT